MLMDCENYHCGNYGGLGCHGCDDPMNQTCCRLELNKAAECLNSAPEFIHYEFGWSVEIKLTPAQVETAKYCEPHYQQMLAESKS